ncbi:MAG: LytR C-terminal domain-containing protein [Pontimonas sp.]
MAKASRFLPDRFDDVEREPGYIGLRRQQREKTFWLVPIGIVLGVSVVLTAIGMFMVSRADQRLELSPEEIAITEPPPEEVAPAEPEAEPEPEPVEAITNPSDEEADGLTITILNGTDTTGLAARAGNLLDREGWPEQTRTNADEQGVESSLVAYESEDDEGLARGVAQILGIEEVVQTDNYPGARITVLLGADFTGN